MARPHDAKEWQTRKERIDPKLDAAVWRRPPKGTLPLHLSHRSEEELTASGPVDCSLGLDNRAVGVVEAKKLTVGPQNVLVLAEWYPRGLEMSAFDFDGFRAPFLYSNNGEQVWFHDVRHPLNRSRKVAGFHAPPSVPTRGTLPWPRAAQQQTSCSAEYGPVLRCYLSVHPSLMPGDRRAAQAQGV
jgi:type I site-specific restriction endonuclease